MLRGITLRIEFHAKNHVDWSFLARRMEMEFEIDLRARCDVAARALTEDVRTLSDGIFIEEYTLLRHLELDISIDRTAMSAGVIGFHHGRPNVMDVHV